MSKYLSEKIDQLELSATDEVDNIIKRMKQDGAEDIISFGGGEPCFDTPDSIILAAKKAMESGKTKYEPTAGDLELRKLLTKKFAEENNISTTPDDIIVTPGGKFAIYMAFQAMLSPGDEVIILDPAWVSYKSMAEIAGARTVHIPSTAAEGFRPQVNLLKQAITPQTKVIVINNPNNPTGVVLGKEVLREIAQVAFDAGCLLLCDEVYEYLLYEGELYSPASEFDNVITVNSFSKSYAMTGWRLGYVTGPSQLVEGMIKIYQHSATCVTAFAQGGAIEALSNPEAKRASEEMVKGYKERRDLTMDLISESRFMESVYPNGAFYAFPKYKASIGSLELAKLLLEKAHVATVPGSAFGVSGEGHLRICYSTSLENIREGFERIEKALSEIA